MNFGSSGVMLSPPTLSNTFGVISPDAMSDSRSPEAPARPGERVASALVKAGADNLLVEVLERGGIGDVHCP